VTVLDGTGQREPSAFRLGPAAELSNAELAELFTAGYADYQFPVQLDEGGFSTMAALSDFDLSLSRIANVDGEPVGICVIGVRGDLGWIGGLGVVPSVRRRGLGRELMVAVLGAGRGAGVRRVSLEVLESNTSAITLYEQLGFERTRMLELWSLSAEAGGSSAEPAGVDDARQWIRANRRVPEPWQRADESVENAVRSGVELDAVMLPDRGAALFRITGEVASVLQLAARGDEAAVQLLAAVRRRGRSLRFLNVPEDDPAVDALRKLGGQLDVRQVEMTLALET
jgi:ribosomal protein S18 acetylase RimI-like enzyme